jgi:ATP-dependent Lon protease
MAAPFIVEPGPFYEALKTISKAEGKFIGVFLTKDEAADIHTVTLEDLHKVGVVARILRILPMEGGGAQVILNMEERATIAGKGSNTKLLQAKVLYHTEKKAYSEELKAYAISIIATIKELLKLNPLFKEELQIFLTHSDFTEPGRLADFAVALTTANRNELQGVLDTFPVHERIDKALLLLKKELDLSRLQNTINQKIDTTLSKTQREYYLREQLKAIKRELGLEKDEKNLDKDKFEARLSTRKVSEEVSKTLQEEIEKLQSLEPQSPEYSMCRNYVDWLTVLPWGIYSQEIPLLSNARKILEEDHWGLDDVKKRIIEFISTLKLSGSLKGTILCLVGPPGVGKTSIGKSIARALNRKFFRFSVGGMKDEAEIKGHRRTYIGAMPGKIIQALKQAQTMNPVIMLDEVDKIGMSYQGDPASALLEVLDPEQNSDFLDHYLDVRCDLSNILFIVTANVLDTIPEPLLDRMEVIRLSGYIREEKVEIARRFLIPKQRKEMGLKVTESAISDKALSIMIDDYAREAGVRALENNIKKILRKIAVDIVDASEKKKNTSHKKMSITEKNLPKFLGKPLFHSDRYYETTPIGVATGLAWTALGGATLFVESIKVPAEKTEMKLTGHAGQVMKESAEIAWSFLQGSIHTYAPEHTFFTKECVHIHFPEGATPKDGPSAGITMVTALLSLLLNVPIPNNLAMTGELTLTGRVLPIGGVKEKLVAAKRSGYTTVIIPKGNLRDFDELSDTIKKGLHIHFVDHYDEVAKIAFPKKKGE